jgi:hypothetical protein
MPKKKLNKSQVTVWWAAINEHGLALPETFSAERHYAEMKMRNDLYNMGMNLAHNRDKEMPMEERFELAKEFLWEQEKKFRYAQVEVKEINT